MILAVPWAAICSGSRCPPVLQRLWRGYAAVVGRIIIVAVSMGVRGGSATIARPVVCTRSGGADRSGTDAPRRAWAETPPRRRHHERRLRVLLRLRSPRPENADASSETANINLPKMASATMVRRGILLPVLAGGLMRSRLVKPAPLPRNLRGALTGDYAETARQVPASSGLFHRY
jgi:hypothetical protein